MYTYICMYTCIYIYMYMDIYIYVGIREITNNHMEITVENGMDTRVT